MTKQFADKLDEILHSKFRKTNGAYWFHYDQSRHQILAAIAEVIGEDEDTRDPGDKRHHIYRPMIRNELRAELRQAFGIEKGKSPTAQIFITNDLPTLLEKGEE